ncbi:MAG: FUSC family protein [Opitutus sp.]
MTEPFFRSKVRGFFERESTRPDLARAIRGTFSVTVPLVLAAGGWLPFNLSFVVFAAHSIALVDVRGAYSFRVALLLAMTAILALASALGGAASPYLVASVLGAALVSACGGVWRHFTPDYGAALAISSTLLYLLAVNTPVATSFVAEPGVSALIGGVWGVFLQVVNWPIRPQHPLRRAVSDSWVAVADLFAALATPVGSARHEQIRQSETTVRTTLDQTYAALAATRSSPIRQRLEDLNLAAARLATRVVALNTALEDLLSTTEGASFYESLQPLLTSLRNTSRSIAVTVVSQQPAHLATCEVRIQRLGHLLRAVSNQIPPQLTSSHGVAQLRSILQQSAEHLPGVLKTLRATVDRAGERAAFSLELLDLDTWTLRPLASAINLNHRPDPALIRFTARLMVLMMLGVAVFKHWALPHGYWLPLTMVIVLQPDYGSTRQRAAERVLGTLIGSVAASVLLWLHLPLPILTATTAVTIFFFGFFLKRQYAVAVVFITLAVVLLTEAHGPVTVAFTVERLASTLAGGAMALVAALFFWPVWERDRLPPILAGAVNANREFLRLIAGRYLNGGTYDDPAILAKRKAESANSAVFSSLQRMMGDPHNRRAGLDQIAACANGNQRVTRALTVLAVQLTSGDRLDSSAVADAAARIDGALAHIASMFRPNGDALPPNSPTPGLSIAVPPVTGSSDAQLREHGILTQLSRIATEINAMQLALANSASPNRAPDLVKPELRPSRPPGPV